MVVTLVYIHLVAVSWSFVLLRWRRAILRAELAAARGESVEDVYEAAFLKGGPARVVDTALAVMHLEERLRIGGPGIVAAGTGEPRDAVERAVLDRLAVAPNGSLGQVRGAVMRAPAVQGIGDALAARGLMRPPGKRPTALPFLGRLLATLSVLGVPVGIVLSVVRPFDESFEVPFAVLTLPAVILGIGVGASVSGFADLRTTKAGRRALKAHEARHTKTEVPGLLVALKGPGAVSDTALRTVLAAAALAPVAFVAATAGGGSPDTAAAQWCGAAPGTSCGSGDGGSGGGDGGGCGGCGGCGCGG
ncbi:TIGR04222 domain-containing membrane protein [Streptomyces sp. NPDC014894]|uniref:TIGR04222 domain-containing membrane protein n=1 Tax=Streptomyces sp. NPDC014894 TaxID=3364931 RepID=UPI0036F88F48